VANYCKEEVALALAGKREIERFNWAHAARFQRFAFIGRLLSSANTHDSACALAKVNNEQSG
jgi:hypothetical protein